MVADKVALWRCVLSFWSSLFGGSSPTLTSAIGQAGKTSAFTSNLGQNLTGQAGNYYSSLLSGDPKATAKLLAPQIGTLTKQGQQAKKTMAEFSDRSGGMASKGQTVDDTTRASISDMINTLTGNAAGAAATMGGNLIDTGLKSLGMQVDMSQQQMQNWEQSILGKGITSGIAAGESYGMGKMFPTPTTG
jgi:hypothetical protein